MAGTRASTRLAASTVKQIAKASGRLSDADINPLASALSAGIVNQTGGNLVDGSQDRETVAQFATRREGFLNMPLDILVEV
ncbi:hypothetical protein TRAPUB_7874 [Trametes pubescens]|uniref:Uncharacterized protein n=1 Tax=Trametes pubescens TaxID=154538 RepID=A0A1M2V259_TRAPU|nr:hypothetical protein TRAPUB_7874 [Trametes pubescens]